MTDSHGGRDRTAYDYPHLDLSVHRDGTSTWIVEVQGELDLATGALLKGHLDSYLRSGATNGSPPRISYVLSDLSFIDCSGLRALLSAADGYEVERITIREPSRAVRQLLEVLGLDAMIEHPARR